MPQELQVKLLRVLESGTFTRVGTTTPISADVRVLAATNRSPEGRSRMASCARTSITASTYSRSRCRRCASAADIELLAEHFLAMLNKQEERLQEVRARDHRGALRAQLAGNVRELKNYVQRAFILADDVIDANLAPAAVAAPESGRCFRCASARRSRK